HDAFRAHGDVGVQLPVERLGERILRAIRFAVPEPVEVADLVWTVVGAVTRADAPVVYLHVETVRRVVRRIDRTYRLARRVAAMLTQHRHEARFEILGEPSVLRALVVTLETNPI